MLLAFCISYYWKILIGVANMNIAMKYYTKHPEELE